MNFSDKLDLLMNITNTTNSILARKISMDASFISRLRRGARSPVRKANYIQAMAEYFARKCSAEYQKAALLNAIKSTSKLRPQDFETITQLMHKWLMEEKAEGTDSIEVFLEGFIDFKFKKPAPITAVNIDSTIDIKASDIEVLYGVEGKQNAVITFLSLVLKNPRPQTLLLYSNEDLAWLTENREFTVKWAALLEQVIRGGNRIKIIHTVSRSFDEMLSAIREWVPLYMTGSIEPYYYPKTRDGIFRRTLFIAPDTAAVASTSVGTGTKNAANFLYTDKDMVNALIEEYSDFLALCRPLMNIFAPNSKADYLSILSEFEDEGANRIVKTDGLSNITMPPDVMQSLLARIKNPVQEQLLNYQQKRIVKFEDSLKKYRFTEVVSIPDLQIIKAGKLMVNFTDMVGDSVLFYTPEEFSKHLQNIIRLLKTYDNFDIHFARNSDLEGCMVYVKEDVGVLVGKTSLPTVIFAINESNMTAAFWDYMTVGLQKTARGKRKKNNTIAELTTIVDSLGI